MTNWHDPVVIKAQNGLFVFWPWNGLLMQVLHCSFSYQIYPCLGWHLHVSFIHLTFGTAHHLRSPSWEILSNLSYEYSVITGKRKLTRTFPVCSLPSFRPRSQDQKIYWTPSDLFGVSLVPFVFNRVPVSGIRLAS